MTDTCLCSICPTLFVFVSVSLISLFSSCSLFSLSLLSDGRVDVDLHMDEHDLSPYSAHSSRSRASSGAVPPGLHLEHPDLGLGGGLGPSGEDLLQWEKRCGE